MRFVSLGNIRVGLVRIIVDHGCVQFQGVEDEAVDGFLKWQPGLLFNDQSEQIVGGVLFMQKFRAGLEEQLLPFNFSNETGGSLMMLKNLVVIRKAIDVRKTGALGQEIANRDPVASFNARDEG